MRRLVLSSLVLLVIAMCVSCAGGGGQNPPPPTVTVLPPEPSVRAGATQQFNANVTGISNPTLTWAVNGSSGNSTIGTIDGTGLYKAPATLPAPNTVTIEAAVTSDTSLNGSTGVTLLNPIPQVTGISPALLNVGAFTITASGSNFVTGAVVNFGSLALATIVNSSSSLTATGTATSAQIGPVQVTVTNPNPGSASSSPFVAQVAGGTLLAPEVADRFLEQTTFGPTSQLIAQVQLSGKQGFLSSQFALPASPYADPGANEMGMGALEQRFFVQILTAPDQLRQRTAFALGQIFVIAADKINTPQAFTPYLRLLEADAFTNYRQIMKDVTLSPAMGHYLDLVNSDKPNLSAGDHANENYARELMQLFTIGTSSINNDGSFQLDPRGNPIPTYSQDMVEAFARAYTGWTYPTMPGATPMKHNPPYWNGPMVADDANHDTSPKQLLQYPNASMNGLIPGGQTAEQDLEAAMDNIFNHPNLPPFVSRELIQHLVTSNPSPAYIQRVANVFINNGASVRGDMQAVITAILLDPEARRGDVPANSVATDGHLEEPILYMTGLLRAFNAQSDGSNLAGQGGGMGQTALFPGSVFNFYSPNFIIPETPLFGPEFQILTTATSLNRVNWVNSFVFASLGSGTSVDFSPYANQASNLSAMLDSLNVLMLHGTMSADDKSSILTAVQAVPAGPTQALQQAKTAIYLIASSSQYQVQH
jgi:uncharacterized protein (DUF1800 family)